MIIKENTSARSSGPSVGDSLLNGAKSVFRRIGVHCLALFGGMLVNQVSAAVNGIGWMGVIFSVYVGFVCLVARPKGKYSDNDWYIPFAAGILIIISSCLLGATLPGSIVMGGLGTYILRFLHYKGRFGFEYAALPIVLCSILVWSKHLDKLPSMAVTTFVIIVVADIINLIITKISNTRIIKSQFTHLLLNLRNINNLENADREIKAESQRLSLKLDKLINKATKSDLAKFSDRINLVIKQSSDFLSNSNSIEDSALLASLKSLNLELDPVFLNLPADEKNKDKYSVYEDNVNELMLKKSSLPVNIGNILDSIYDSTLGIVAQMRQDEADRANGESFLRRYLKSAHSVVDEYIRLKKQGVESDELNRTFKRAQEVLERLDSAFKKEYEFMLQNDSVNFMAELNALDSFMKMHGHSE